MECTACLKPLTGGLDTYGEIQHPMCMGCHFAIGEPKKERIIHMIELDDDGHLVSIGVRIEAAEPRDEECQ